MTRIRHEYLQNSLVLADSGEKVDDIGSNDIITRLDVELRATNGATNNQAAHIADILTSFELFDGGNVILSLTGNEFAGLVAGRMGKVPHGIISEVPAIEQSLRFSWDFGRWYGDEDMALNCARFKNLQYRVRYNLAAIRAVGVTGFATGTGRLTVVAHVMEGARDPVAYLTAKRHSLFTTAATGDEPNPLPVDAPIRAIAIRSWETGVGGLSGISNIKLTGDEGKFIPVNFTTNDFLQSVVLQGERQSYQHDFHAQNADTLFALLKWREAVNLVSNDVDVSGHYVPAGIGEGTLEAETMSTAAALAVDTAFFGQVEGYLPFATAYWQQGQYDDPNSWLNAQDFKKLILVLTQNNAGASTAVLVEQAMGY